MARSNEDAASLIAQTGPLNGQRWVLGDSTILGRDGECDIVIPDRQVSRQHAKFVYTSDGYKIEDLGSKNGTHLNGSLLHSQAALLSDGDIVQIALAQQFVFLSSDATLPIGSELSDLQVEMIRQQGIKHPDGDQEKIPVPTGRLRLDKRARRAWISIEGEPLPVQGERQTYREVEIDPPLSAAQFHLLEVLYDSVGEVVSRQDLIAAVWGSEEAIGVSEQAFDAMVRRLRDRLAGFDPTQNYIVTVRGHGLRLDNPSL
jgi:hypothetical protein